TPSAIKTRPKMPRMIRPHGQWRRRRGWTGGTEALVCTVTDWTFIGSFKLIVRAGGVVLHYPEQYPRRRTAMTRVRVIRALLHQGCHRYETLGCTRAQTARNRRCRNVGISE